MCFWMRYLMVCTPEVNPLKGDMNVSAHVSFALFLIMPVGSYHKHHTRWSNHLMMTIQS
jgi:hypothetical protein